jgi:hypothetical protein
MDEKEKKLIENKIQPLKTILTNTIIELTD